MIKKISLKAPLFMAACMAFALVLAGCGGSGSPAGPGIVNGGGNNGNGIPTFTVTFNSNGGTPVAPLTVPEGGRAARPIDPVGVPAAGLWYNARAFVEWQHGGTEWDFATTVTGDITLTAHWYGPAAQPVTGVPANDVGAAVTHVNSHASPERAFTLAIGLPYVPSGNHWLNRSNANLTIVGFGGQREIRFNGEGFSLFEVTTENGGGVLDASLTLGNGITLRGLEHIGPLVYIRNASTFAMEDGSKITGHINTGGDGAAAGAVTIGGGSTFYMRGGTITGNHADSGRSGEVAGVFVFDPGSLLNQTGGSIIGNTIGTGEYPNVRISVGATRTGIGGEGNS